MSEGTETTKKDDPMDVDALSKGKSKGKGKRGSSGKGKGSKGQNQMNKCWNCGKTGHYARNCSEWCWSRGKAKVGQKQVRKVTNMLMDGLGVMSMLMGCEKHQTGRQELVQDGGRRQTIGHLWKQKNQWVESRSTAWKDCGARTLEGVESREREAGKDHERRESWHHQKYSTRRGSSSKTSQTVKRVVRVRRVPVRRVRRARRVKVAGAEGAHQHRDPRGRPAKSVRRVR